MGAAFVCRKWQRDNTDSGYQYGVSKANGTATAIVAYGKVPVVFNGVTHAARTMSQLTGE